MPKAPPKLGEHVGICPFGEKLTGDALSKYPRLRGQAGELWAFAQRMKN